VPHFHIDYSRNLEARLDLPGFLVALRDAALATGVFPLAGIRLRAVAVDHVIIADGDPGHGFVDVTIRVGAGRDTATKTRALEAIFSAGEAFCQPLMDSSPFMLSMELREIDAEMSRKSSSIRRYLPKGDL
jgi:5-carboxymethyl-2-hydroxymuconate isomerase